MWQYKAFCLAHRSWSWSWSWLFTFSVLRISTNSGSDREKGIIESANVLSPSSATASSTTTTTTTASPNFVSFYGRVVRFQAKAGSLHNRFFFYLETGFLIWKTGFFVSKNRFRFDWLHLKGRQQQQKMSGEQRCVFPFSNDSLFSLNQQFPW